MKQLLTRICHILILMLLISPQVGLLAQVGCPDGQGVNALTDGDFGSGVANILATDPGIAPGYTYTTNPPPDDGFYIITNNTGPWGSFAANWIDIRDNSPDPNGYMMVVNANFSPGIFYSQLVDVCSESEYQFSADIINLLLPTLPDEILPNIDFLVDGQVFYSTGNIAQNGQWQSVGFVFTTQPGQTSVLIEIRNNAPGGQGNDLALDNIVFFNCGPLVTISAPSVLCGSQMDSIEAFTSGGNYANPVYQWQQSTDGVNWQDIPGAIDLVLYIQLSEDLFFRIITADGLSNLSEANCRVVTDPTFIIYTPEEFFDTLNLCVGDILEIAGTTISAPGNFDIPLISSRGCDSLLHLNVKFAQHQTLVLYDSICAGQTYLGATYFSSAILADSLLSSEGCDSIVITNLFVDPLDIILPIDVTINLGDSYLITPTFSGSIVLYSWSPDSAITCTDCPSVIVDPTITTIYQLNVISAFGCPDTASILINVLFENDIYIPSAFSPNDDGINDVFSIFPNGNIMTIESLTIYDRWGAVVFQVKDVPPNSNFAAWDGTINDKDANLGVYTYYGEFRTRQGKLLTRKGDVTLLR